MKRKRVWREWQHPRDDRGRFSRSGGGSWAKRAAGAFAKAEEGRTLPPSAPGRPRVGRSAKAGLILNQHSPGAGDALSRKWTPPEKLPPGAERRSARDLGLGEVRQVLHEGVWRRVVGSGWGGGSDHITVEVDDGERVKLTDDGKGFISRPFQLELREPLRPGQTARMAAWRADASQSPRLRVPTIREDNIARYERDIAEGEAKLKEAKKKARARVRKKYPSSDGYTKRDWDYYVNDDDEVRAAERDLYHPRLWLEHTRQPDPNPDTEAYLNQPGSSAAVLDGELDRERPLAVYGDLLNIQDNDQATFRHLADLELVPAELHAIVAGAMFHERHRWSNPEIGRAAGIWVGSRPVPELNHSEDLATVRPRGWDENKTWAHVDGAYRQGSRTIIVGVSPASSHRGEHGQPALHEFGHALDHAVSDVLRRDDPNFPSEASRDPAWLKIWRQTVEAAPNINPYFRQMENDAGAEEFWAEAFAEWSRARAKARKSDLYADGGSEYLAARGEMAMVRAFQIPAEGKDAAIALNNYFEGLVGKLGVDL